MGYRSWMCMAWSWPQYRFVVLLSSCPGRTRWWEGQQLNVPLFWRMGWGAGVIHKEGQGYYKGGGGGGGTLIWKGWGYLMKGGLSCHRNSLHNRHLTPKQSTMSVLKYYHLMFSIQSSTRTWDDHEHSQPFDMGVPRPPPVRSPFVGGGDCW